MSKGSAILLTERTVAAARAAPGERLELWDSKSSGLCLRVSEKGKTWVVRYRTLDGRQPRWTLGMAGGGPGELRLVEARDRAGEIRRLAKGGLDPSTLKLKKAAEVKAGVVRTLDDLAQDYFLKCEKGLYKARRKQKKPETIAGERRLWDRHLKSSLGSTLYAEVRRNDIRDTLSTIAGSAPVYANRARALVRAIYNYAIKEDLIAANPVVGVAAPADETARERTLSDDEIRAVWSALENPHGLTLTAQNKERPLWIGEDVRLALRLSFLTLQRRSEVAGMLKSELRLDEGLWIIGKGRAKNGKSHVVPLAPVAVELIRRAIALQSSALKTDAVFPSPKAALEGQAIDGGALTHALVDVYAAVGVAGANLHDIRRTGASAMVSERLKVPPVVVSRILNHSLDGGGAAAVTFRHYAIYDYASEKRDALNAWADLLATIVTPRHQPS